MGRWLEFVAFMALGSVLNAQESSRPLIVCSTTQVADFARQVVGDRCDVRSILAPGADPHLYQPTTADARLVAKADLCLENGLHLEGKDWMKAISEAAGKKVVRCTEGVEPLQMDEHGEKVADPHAWFSPLNAAVYTRNIVLAVSKMDPEHKDEYQARGQLYLDQLRALDQWITKQVNAVPRDKRILVTSHDAFNYYCKAYGFTSAAPVGWSTGQEVGGGTDPTRRRAAVESVRKFGVKAVFVETSVNPKLVRELAAEAGVKIGGELYSDSMGEIGTAGETYIGMMRENTLTIVRALK